MDFAANAVLDANTLPTRQTQARAPAAEESEGSRFDDHLDAAALEDTAPSAETPADQPREQSSANETTDPTGALGGEVAAVAPPAPQAAAMTPPMFVQLISNTPRPAQHGEATQPTAATPGSAQAAQPSAPAQQKIAAPTQTPAAAQDTAAPATADATAAPEAKVGAPMKTAPAEKSVTTAPQTAQPAQSASLPQILPATAAPAAAQTAPPADTAALSPTMAPAQGQPAPEHAARQPKAFQAQAEAKFEATPDRAAGPAPTAAPRDNAKVAAPPSAGKDAAAFTALLDAPEAAPQQQASSALAGAATSSTQTQHAVAEQSAARAAPAAHQVAREIVRKFDGGNTRFELRLDPPELGRVEVRLDLSRDHRVTAVIAADSPQALTELARHARDLEQMLQGAGLELSDNGLSFDLRQGGERAEMAEFSGAIGDDPAQVEDAAPVAARPLGYERWRGVRVDMMV